MYIYVFSFILDLSMVIHYHIYSFIMSGSTSNNGIGLMLFKKVIHPMPVFVKFASSQTIDLQMSVKLLKNESDILSKLALSQVIIRFVRTYIFLYISIYFYICIDIYLDR